MNAPLPLPHDYRSQMQAKAKAFLQAHHAEHLADDAQLIERTTSHLVHQYDVPLFLAPRLVELAITEWLCIDLSNGPDNPGHHHFT